MKPATAQLKVQKRPGGRTANVTDRVHKAIIDLIVDGGVAACTFSAVAARAGIERSTLYRRFPDRWDAIINAFIARGATDVMPDLGDSFASDLKSVLRKLVELLESPLGPALQRVATELRAKSPTDYSRTYIEHRMNQLRPMFDAAIERGELPADVDPGVLFASSAGPIYYRIFIAGRPVDQAFIDTIVDNICRLYCQPCSATVPLGTGKA